MTAIVIRRATATDREFVLKSWADNYKMSHNAGPLPVKSFWVYEDCPTCGGNVPVDRSYWPTMMAVLGELLARPGIEVHVAAVPDEAPPDDIYGWIAIERDVWAPKRQRVDGWTEEVMAPLEQALVHYVFVKQGFREHGVARRLFAAAGVDRAKTFFYSFSTATAAAAAKHRKADGTLLLADARFDPRLSRFPKTSP